MCVHPEDMARDWEARATVARALLRRRFFCRCTCNRSVFLQAPHLISIEHSPMQSTLFSTCALHVCRMCTSWGVMQTLLG